VEEFDEKIRGRENEMESLYEFVLRIEMVVSILDVIFED